MNQYQCQKCKCELTAYETYEYRGAYSCADCFDAVIDARDRERNEIIKEETLKTEVFKDLDLGDSVIGAANRKLMKGRIEVAKKESSRLASYEKREKK